MSFARLSAINAHCDSHELLSFTPGGSHPLPQAYIAGAKGIVQDHPRFQGIHPPALIQDGGIGGHIDNPGKDRGKMSAVGNFNELAFDDQGAALNDGRIDKLALNGLRPGSLEFVGNIPAGYAAPNSPPAPADPGSPEPQ